MSWKRTQILLRDFDEAFVKLTHRVETAYGRGDQLTWKNYRKWYITLVRKTKNALMRLRKELRRESMWRHDLQWLESSLREVFNVQSDTKKKWDNVNQAGEIWKDLKKKVERDIRLEYDLFPKRDFQSDSKLCFVLMPFDKKFKLVYTKAIGPAARRSGLKARRADEIFRAAPVVQDVWEYINKAELVVADVTDRNPNVFYEIGLSHALPKPLILITQKKEDVPFDVQHVRWIQYTNSEAGRHKLTRTLYRTIKNILR